MICVRIHGTGRRIILRVTKNKRQEYAPNIEGGINIGFCVIIIFGLLGRKISKSVKR